jgi:hypothetical protein
MLVGRGTVITETGEIIAELTNRSSRKQAARLQCGAFSFHPQVGGDGVCSVTAFDEPALLMCGPTDLSYGDWLANFPPRLALAEAAGIDAKVVVGRDIPRPFLDMLQALGVGSDRILFHDPDGVSVFPRLYASSWPAPERERPMKDWFGVYRRLAAPRHGRELIYLSRSRIANRRLLQETEIEALFAGKGFRILHPEELGFAETRAAFAGAALVAGAYGSAFRSVLFCQDKPLMLALMPPYPEAFLTGVGTWVGEAGARVALVRGRAAPGAPGRSANEELWTVDLDAVRRDIDAMLERLP